MGADALPVPLQGKHNARVHVAVHPKKPMHGSPTQGRASELGKGAHPLTLGSCGEGVG